MHTKIKENPNFFTISTNNQIMQKNKIKIKNPKKTQNRGTKRGEKIYLKIATKL
jgi:hypothetical protein